MLMLLLDIPAGTTLVAPALHPLLYTPCSTPPALHPLLYSLLRNRARA